MPQGQPAAFESCAAVQRDRIARREQVAIDEDAMLAYAIEHAKAMRQCPPAGVLGAAQSLEDIEVRS